MGCSVTVRNTDLALERLQNPSGTFTQDSAAALDVLDETLAPTLAQSALRRTARNVELLGVDPTACANAGLCACTEGGSLEVSEEHDGRDTRLTAVVTGCKMGQQTFSGRLEIWVTAESLLTAKTLGDIAPVNTPNVLILMEGTLTHENTKRKVGSTHLQQAGARWVSVVVPDGTITAGMRGSALEIKAKDRIITCSVVEPEAKCVADNGERFSLVRTSSHN